jgi:hypothetical protein
MRPTDRNRFQRDAERRFPIKVDIPVPPGGLGRRLTDMLDWCHANVAAGRVGGTRAPGAQEGRAASGFSLGSFSLLRPTLKPSGGGGSTNYALT